ncbi:hypothetical protein FOL47_007208 [Perkinsus chesapeaki]|uniref:Uncharacterized protein n=1 Tax=Perkinsus chesapeaki TaxID=330153 RepID=A0A7J6LM97_PERCH|nr:hypothetical protein FOL47_007208 [Perkinsus chesapeaki]
MTSSSSSHQKSGDEPADLDAWEIALKCATSEGLSSTLSLRQYLESVQREADLLRDSVTDLREECQAMREVLATKDKIHVRRVDDLLEEVAALRKDNERMAILAADAEEAKSKNLQLTRRNAELEQEMKRLRSSNTALSSQLMQAMNSADNTETTRTQFDGRPMHEEDEEELSLAEDSDDPKVILEILNRQRARAQRRELELVEQIDSLTKRVEALSSSSSVAITRESNVQQPSAGSNQSDAAAGLSAQLKSRVQSTQSGIAEFAGRFFG